MYCNPYFIPQIQFFSCLFSIFFQNTDGEIIFFYIFAADSSCLVHFGVWIYSYYPWWEDSLRLLKEKDIESDKTCGKNSKKSEKFIIRVE